MLWYFQFLLSQLLHHVRIDIVILIYNDHVPNDDNESFLKHHLQMVLLHLKGNERRDMYLLSDNSL